MNLQKRIGPFMKDDDSVSKIMSRYSFALLPIIVFVFFKHGILNYIYGYTNIFGMLYPLIFMSVGVMSSLISEEIFLVVFKKMKNQDLIDNIIKNYSYLPGLILSLILPINTPLAILFIGGIFSSIIGKMIYGGFGNNIYNPSILGAVFIYSSYASLINENGGYLNAFEVIKENHFIDYLIGNVIGPVGTAPIILLTLSFIYLLVTKTINYRVSISYIITFLVLGLMANIPYIIITLSTILFVSCFLTNPAPVTSKGSILYGITLGILSYVLYFSIGYIGILISILILNTFIMFFDKIGSRIEFNKIYYLFFILVILVGYITGIVMNNNNNINSEVITYEYIH